MECYFFNAKRNKIINKNKVEKFYDTKVETKIIIRNNFNKFIFDNINKYDIFIITFDNKNIDYIPEYIPRFPILYNDYFIFNEFNLKEINGLSNSDNIILLINDLIIRIKNNFGVIITNNIDFKILNFKIDTSYNTTSIGGYKDYYNTNIEKLDNVTNCYSNKTYLPNNTHGWFAPMNKVVLKYILHNFNIKCIAELGAWLGKSTLYMASNSNAKIYSFDKFQNTFISPYMSTGNNILDKFYFKYLRFETFHSNLSKFKNVFSVKYDCYNSVNFLKSKAIDVSLFYIDFLKNTNRLVSFIIKVKKLYPKAIIIGDDYVIKSVKKAINILQRKYKIYTFKTCYVIFPFKISNFENEINDNEIIKIKEIINKNILDISNNKLYLYETALEILKRDFSKFIKYIKLYKLDLNLRSNSDYFYNTLYINFYIIYKENKEFKSYESELKKYQLPNNNKNELLLSALDYRNNIIDL